jgi:hypothetical protein
VHPFRQAHAGGVGESASGVDLRGDHFAVDDERGAERPDARAGLGIGQGGRDDRPRGSDDRAVGWDGVADEGRLAVIGGPPLWGLQAEEGSLLGPVVDVVLELHSVVVRHTFSFLASHSIIAYNLIIVDSEWVSLSVWTCLPKCYAPK